MKDSLSNEGKKKSIFPNKSFDPTSEKSDHNDNNP